MNIFTDYIQWGFAGMAFAMLAVIVWMFKKVFNSADKNTKLIVEVVNKNNKVLARLIDTINDVEAAENRTAETVERYRIDNRKTLDAINSNILDVRDRILERPCIVARRDAHVG